MQQDLQAVPQVLGLIKGCRGLIRDLLGPARAWAKERAEQSESARTCWRLRQAGVQLESPELLPPVNRRAMVQWELQEQSLPGGRLRARARLRELPGSLVPARRAPGQAPPRGCGPSVLMRPAPWLLPQVRSSGARLSCSPLAMLPCLTAEVLEALSPLLEAWRTARCSRSRG